MTIVTNLTLQKQLSLMTGITLVGMLIVMLFSLFNLGQLRKEFGAHCRLNLGYCQDSPGHSERNSPGERGNDAGQRRGYPGRALWRKHGAIAGADREISAHRH